MRSTAFGLVAALVAATLVPAAAMSQANKAPAITDAARKSGMAEAPPLVQTAGLPCQVTDARLIGKTKADRRANTPAAAYYEVACQQGMGFVVSQPEGGAPTAFSCIEANTPPEGQTQAAMACLLPANSDPKAVVGPMLQKTGLTCTPTQLRGIGQSQTQSYFEVACQEGSGYVVIASAPFDVSKTIEAQNCLSFDDSDGNIKCTLSDKAARLAVVDNYVTEAKNNCAIKDRRFVGTSQDGSNFFETSCNDGKGYIYKVATNGSLAQTWDCARAQQVLGGCTLTDAREAESAQAALYTRLAQGAGSTCDVEKYALFPMRGTDEVVELVCKDGKGAVGIFPASGKGQVLGCGHALAAGYKCGMGTDPGYDALTADLRKFDQKTCTVSNARPAAKTDKGTILVEVACSDGFKGYMIEYNATTYTAVGAIGCAFAGGCALPGNT
jgi:hypothetical protein